MSIIQSIKQQCVSAVQNCFDVSCSSQSIAVQKTKESFVGDFTIVIFPLVKSIKKSPEEIGQKIGEFLQKEIEEIASFNVVKGFLNIELSSAYWVNFTKNFDVANYWTLPTNGEVISVEYCGPNTNKPLHLGHVRNMLIGWSMAEILQAAGNKVHKVNIYNDRGIAICKSMVAWQQFANGKTPESTGSKGDHFVGKYYVRYAQEETKQAQQYLDSGMDAREAAKQTEIFKLAQSYLQRWEDGDEEILGLWKEMNSWVYQGFNQTYDKLEVDFEKDYLESETYLLGKQVVNQGLTNKQFFKKDDGSIWVDLQDVGLDEKILLRSDGTSVYITQDLGTADLRYEHFKMDKSIYVVGSEQDYHFKVLAEVSKKLDRPYASGIYHLSYGMVDLPSGKMKSREGTVVDADDLIDQMIDNAKQSTEERGKISEFSEEQKKQLFYDIGLGGLKYFILKVNPRKRILFDPKESIDLQGHTGPFIQYTFARIQSMLANVEQSTDFDLTSINDEERLLVNLLFQYKATLTDAAKNLDPSLIANYAYELAKTYNKFYAQHSVLKEEKIDKKKFRIHLSFLTSLAIKHTLALLGIHSPEKM